MKNRTLVGAVALTLCVSWTAPAAAKKCPADSVQVGPACIDTYEASVWQIPPTNTALVKKVQSGKVTLADLTGGGATQLGCTFAPFSHTAYPANFPASGQWTPEEDVMDTWATSSMSPQIAGFRLSDPELYAAVYPFTLRPQGHDIIRTWAYYTIVKNLENFGSLPWNDIMISGWAVAGAVLAVACADSA